jgi:hypothetical protein
MSDKSVIVDFFVCLALGSGLMLIAAVSIIPVWV